MADRRRARGSIGLYLKSCAAHPRTDDEKRVTYELVKNGTKAEDLDRLAEEYEHTPRPAPLAKTGNLVADIASFVDREQREGIVLRAQMMRENQAAYADLGASMPWMPRASACCACCSTSCSVGRYAGSSAARSNVHECHAIPRTRAPLLLISRRGRTPTVVDESADRRIRNPA